MKILRKLLILFTFFVSTAATAQPFVTVWNLATPGSSPTGLSFGVGTTGIVNYTWETIPAGMNGSGTFAGSTATITGLPSGAMIRLAIDTANFNRIRMYSSLDTNRLLDVEQWGGVHWVNMSEAFRSCSNLNITTMDIPDLSAVTDMSAMFWGCSVLNGPTNIDSWNTGNVTNMSGMFWFSSFNQPIGNWNTGNVTNMSGMFQYSNFNQPIGTWNTGNVTDMSWMFSGAQSFNQPIGTWNTGNVTNMSRMFWFSSFNQPIGTWNTGNVTDMFGMFQYSSFNQPIGTWNTANVTDMSSMFSGATSFNQPIGTWNTANVIDMSGMFLWSSFNQPIGNWNTANVIYMSDMFQNATSFNQPIGTWNTANVMYMNGMFQNATSFNQPIGNWNTQNVSHMGYMFSGAQSFNQPIGNWNISNVIIMLNMLGSCGMDCSNYSTTLNGWNANVSSPNNLQLGAMSLQYGLNAVAARSNLINVKGWTITGDSLVNQICGTFPVGIPYIIENTTNLLTIYPNPTQDKLYVSIDKTNYSPSSKLEIYNTLGQLLLTKEVMQASRTELDMSSLDNGVYYLRYGQYVNKVLVE